MACGIIEDSNGLAPESEIACVIKDQGGIEATDPEVVDWDDEQIAAWSPQLADGSSSGGGTHDEDGAAPQIDMQLISSEWASIPDALGGGPIIDAMAYGEPERAPVLT